MITEGLQGRGRRCCEENTIFLPRPGCQIFSTGPHEWRMTFDRRFPSHGPNFFRLSGKFQEDLPYLLIRRPHPRSTCFVLKEFRRLCDEHTSRFVSNAARKGGVAVISDVSFCICVTDQPRHLQQRRYQKQEAKPAAQGGQGFRHTAHCVSTWSSGCADRQGYFRPLFGMEADAGTELAAQCGAAATLTRCKEESGTRHFTKQPRASSGCTFKCGADRVADGCRQCKTRRQDLGTRLCHAPQRPQTRRLCRDSTQRPHHRNRSTRAGR